MPRKKYTGTCIYCGYAGKLSKEHIFSSWLGKHFEKDMQRFDAFITHPEVPVEPITKLTKTSGAMHTRKEPVVCKDCNNSWMSNIVCKSKPVEEKLMVADSYVDMTAEECHLLREKVALTCITIDAINHKRTRLLTPDDRRELWKRGHLLPSIQFTSSTSRMPTKMAPGRTPLLST